MADTKSILASKAMCDHEPELMQGPEEAIYGDLENNYEYGPAAFHSNERFEAFHRRKQRLGMVEKWLKGRPNWMATKTQKVNILTALFYYIWDAKQKTTAFLMRRSTQVSLGSKREIFNSEASAHYLSPNSSSPPALREVNLQMIIQYMLQKIRNCIYLDMAN